MVEHILTLRIKKIITETKEAASFVLEEINGKVISYKAGQFLTLILNTNGHETRRSYSISSTPGIDSHVQITVKRVHNGEISRHLLDHYKEGNILKALMPSGMFVMNEHKKSEDVFLLAAGSGITPVFSLLKDILYNRDVLSVILFYQNHAEHDTIFRNELQQLAIDFSTRFTWFDFVSNPQHADYAMRRMNNDILEQTIPALMKYKSGDATFFICGPLSFMRMCQYTLMLMGFAQAQIKKEYFVINTPPAPPLMINTLPRTVFLKNVEPAISFTTTFPQTILQSALEQGIALPYSCRGAKCSTCVARCVSGEVVMSMNDVLTDEDLKHGLVLTCVGYAATDLVLEYQQQ
jgi:ring-1,2-phenylacetyl-CoA epoxidase subunit PaaE